MPKIPGQSLVRARMVRGTAAGSRFWTAISAVLFIRGLLKRMAGSQNPVLFSHKLGPGETLVITSQSEGVRVEGAPQGNMEV